MLIGLLKSASGFYGAGILMICIEKVNKCLVLIQINQAIMAGIMSTVVLGWQ
jgi:hypothetical protein